MPLPPRALLAACCLLAAGARAQAARPTPSADPICGAPFEGGSPRKVWLGRFPGTREGSRLTLAGPAAQRPLVLGVLGPVRADTGLDLLALERTLAFFRANRADVVVLTGEVGGEEPARIARVLGALAAGGLPVLALTGNTECREDFRAGVALARARYPDLLDLTEVRVVRFPALTLLSLPGTHDPTYLKCRTSCLAAPRALEALAAEARRSPGPVALVSHPVPRGAGASALDWAGGQNVGDEALAALLADAGIAFGLFSGVEGAGPRATADVAGSVRVRPGEPVRRLYLSPGPADATPWALEDGGTSHGLAAVVTVSGALARWTPFRLPAPSAADRATAARRAPKP